MNLRLTRFTAWLFTRSLLVLAVLITLIPFLWLVAASFKSNEEFFRSTFLPMREGSWAVDWSRLTFDAYQRLFVEVDFGRGLINSIFLSSVTGVLATLWARTRIDDLMRQDYSGIQRGTPKDEVKEAITQLGLEYRLMTQFTSFVAVEEMTVTEGGQPRRVDVPVELPEGVNRESLFGQKGDSPFERLELMAKLQKPPKVAYNNLGAPPPPAPPSIMNQASVSAGIARDKSETPLPETRHLTVYSEPLLVGVIKKVMPVYPPAIRASGVVKVHVALNQDGEVEDVEVLTGHPLLRASVVHAAQRWQFKPAGIDGGPIKIHGVLAFKFSMDKNGTPIVAVEAQPISPRLRQVWTKLDPSVSAVIERWIAKDDPTANENTFVQAGNARLQVQLTDKTSSAIARLKKLGFVVEQNPQSSKLVIGRLPIEKLEALAALEIVRYVSPLSSK